MTMEIQPASGSRMLMAQWDCLIRSMGSALSHPGWLYDSSRLRVQIFCRSTASGAIIITLTTIPLTNVRRITSSQHGPGTGRMKGLPGMRILGSEISAIYLVFSTAIKSLDRILIHSIGRSP